MKDFCLFASSSGFQLSNGLEFIKVTVDLSKQLGVSLNHMDYVLAEDDLNDIKKDKSFSDRNVRHLNRILTKKTLVDLNLWSDQEQSETLPYRSLDSELIDTELEGYKYACIHFPMDLVKNWSFNRLATLTSEMLINLNKLGKLESAFILNMDALIPSTYFRGIYTSDLSEEEAINLAAWESKYVDHRKILRNLYWGNLLNSNQLTLLSNNKFELLEYLRLANCFTTSINNDDLFFMFPSPDSSSNSTDRIKSILNDSGILLRIDDAARQTARNNLSIYK